MQAITAEYYIKAMGMKISYISICTDAVNNSIEVKTHSLKTSSLFPQLDNVYRISHDQFLRPVSYSRIIKQKNLEDQVDVEYNYSKLQAKQKSKLNNSNSHYSILPNRSEEHT
ncbi:MAG: hypothetical protein RBS43_09465, partial [Candidatus Cloacimonas sp.]|nr:hypothetical protein [Candidatus Cloacimonas sp.]